MSKPRDTRQKGLLRPTLDEIIDLGHPLARLAREIDWTFLDRRFSSVCRLGVPARCAGPELASRRWQAGWWPVYSSSSICTICRTRPCALAGWRILTISTSAARRASSTGCPSTAPP